jgi:hypothetical protein
MFAMIRMPRAVGVAAVLGAFPGALGGQSGSSDPAREGTVTGVVLDAATGAALAGATVRLESDHSAVVVTRQDDLRWSAGVASVTDSEGRYRFHRIPQGRYLLRVRRLGYRPASVVVTLRRAAPVRVSVGLEVAPVRLEPEEVTASAVPFGVDRMARAGPATRLSAADLESRRRLTSDARVITRGEVIEAVPLGDVDLLRAMHRLPGVSTRDDYTAELWTRGAPWSYTRVYFDGMPLYNPVHSSGIFSGINPDAIGTVWFLPGVRAPSQGGGAAGVIDLRSRPATADGWSGAVDLSAVSARATVDRQFANGRGGVMVAAQRSYVDLVMGALADLTGDQELRVPYSFLNGVARVSVPLGNVAVVEASGLAEWDYLGGDVRKLIRGSTGSWGNITGRVSVLAPIGGVLTTTTVGGTQFRGRVDRSGTPDRSRADAIPSHSRTDNQLGYGTIATVIEPLTANDRRGWSAGMQLVNSEQYYDGPHPRPYPSDVVYDSLQLYERRSSLALWGDTRWSIGDAFTVDVGLRAEVGDSAPNAPTVVLSPRLAARYAIGHRGWAVSAGYGRSYQFAQAVAPAGPGIGPDLHLTDVWLLAGDSVPAVRSDIVTLGLEGWLSDQWTGSVNLYRRHSVGMTLPDPTPGQFTSSRPVFVPARNRAWGVELSARKLVGRWTASAAYTYGISTVAAEGMVYPSPADRRSAVDATALFRVTRSLRVGAAASLASGAPFTRFILQTLPCDSLSGSCPPPAGYLAIENPNAERAPAFATASVLTDWHKAFRGWELRVYLQVLNVLNRRSAVTYVGSLGACEEAPSGLVALIREDGICDLFDRGLPVLPFVGVTVAF